MAFDGVIDEASGRRNDLLLRLADVLDGVDSKEYNHRVWCRTNRVCGTAACALGWAAIAMGEETGLAPNWTQNGFTHNGQSVCPYVAGSRAFGVTLDESRLLFGASGASAEFYGVEDAGHLLPARVATRIREFVYERVTA